MLAPHISIAQSGSRSQWVLYWSCAAYFSIVETRAPKAPIKLTFSAICMAWQPVKGACRHPGYYIEDHSVGSFPAHCMNVFFFWHACFFCFLVSESRCRSTTALGYGVVRADTFWKEPAQRYVDRLDIDVASMRCCMLMVFLACCLSCICSMATKGTFKNTQTVITRAFMIYPARTCIKKRLQTAHLSMFWCVPPCTTQHKETHSHTWD